MEPESVILAVAALMLGGVLKGATGVGAPLFAIPVLALLFNVQVAVVLFTIPNLLTNTWQVFEYRKELLNRRFLLGLAGGGGLGSFVGSLILAFVDGEVLMAVLGSIVFGYIALRLMRPDFILSRSVAQQVVWPVGIVAGLMQGAGGLSAPVSMTFLNAMRLERGAFIATVSFFFAAMAVVQIPTLFALGVMTPALVGWSLLAAVPLFGAMPLGAVLGKRIDRDVFDRVILLLLAAIALKLFYDALT